MISLRASSYNKNDYIALAVILEGNLEYYLKCSKQGTNACSSCFYNKPCRDFRDFYSYVVEKNKIVNLTIL